MSVNASNKNMNSTAPLCRGSKNIKIKLAMSSFQQFEEQSETIGDNSTKAHSTSTAKSKYSNDTDDNKQQPESFQLNLVNLSPNANIPQTPQFNYDDEEIKEFCDKINKGKLLIEWFFVLINQFLFHYIEKQSMRARKSKGDTKPGDKGKKLYPWPVLTYFIIDRAYKKDFLLASGSYGKVYQVTKQQSGEKFAMKVLSSTFLSKVRIAKY